MGQERLHMISASHEVGAHLNAMGHADAPGALIARFPFFIPQDWTSSTEDLGLVNVAAQVVDLAAKKADDGRVAQEMRDLGLASFAVVSFLGDGSIVCHERAPQWAHPIQ